MLETFIQHPKYKRLLVGNMGNLVSNVSWIVFKTSITKYGYEELKFVNGSRTDGSRKTINLKVHRLVAELFVGNELNKPAVNHKDGIKTNNIYSNLEWVTFLENSQHASKNGLVSHYKPDKLHRQKMMEGHRKWWFDVGFNYRERDSLGRFGGVIGEKNYLGK